MAVAGALLRSGAAWASVALAAVWFGTGAARDGLTRDPRFHARPDVQAARGPAWAGPDAVGPVLERLRDLGPVSLFDPAFEERIRAALAQVPCVREVGAVKRLWPRRYAVEFWLHRPVAVAVCDGAHIPVTRDLVALPHAPYAHALAGLLAVEGAARPPRPGAVWDDPALADGVATAEQLAPHGGRLAPLGIAVIDVSGTDDPRRGVLLKGDRGIVVRWGRPRAEVGENPVAKKVEYLALAASHLDRVRGFEIDVRYGALYLRESTEP